MLLIISVQKYDTLGEIIHKLNDIRQKTKFHCKERMALFVCLLTCLAVVSGAFKETLDQVKDKNEYGFDLVNLSDLIVLLTMSVIFVTLLYKIFK